jgi:hypothetical protein
MSLRWNIEKCADHEALTVEGEAWQLTHAVIFETLVVGIGMITEKNAADFKARSDFWRKLDGMEDRLIPFEAITRRIGLYTNANSETAKGFVSRIAKAWHAEQVAKLTK